MLNCCSKNVLLTVATPGRESESKSELGREPLEVHSAKAAPLAKPARVFTPEEYAWSREVREKIYEHEAVKSALAHYEAHIGFNLSGASAHPGAEVISRLYSLENRGINPEALKEFITELQSAGLVAEKVAQEWLEIRVQLETEPSTLPFARAVEAFHAASSTEIDKANALHRQETDPTI